LNNIDFDFCRECYLSYPPAEHAVESHDFSHTMLLRAAWCQATRVAWIGFAQQEAKKRLVGEIETLAIIKPTSGSVEAGDKEVTHSEPSNGKLRCQRCADPIVYGELPVYVCVEYSCNHKGGN
jgi:hypothetical protein